MKLYHGSTVAVRKPSLRLDRLNADFGKGFYTNALPIKDYKLGKRLTDGLNGLLFNAVLNKQQY